MKQLLSSALLITLLGILTGCASPFATQPLLASATSPVTPVPILALTPSPNPSTTPEVTYSYSASNLFEQEAGFKIRTPTDLPVGYIFEAASYNLEQQAVTVVYDWDDPRTTGETLFITQQRKQPAGEISEDAYTKTVQIGNYSAIFVQGVWNGKSWEKDAKVYQIQWSEPGFYFTVLFIGDTDSTSAGFLTKNMLIELAKQLQ